MVNDAETRSEPSPTERTSYPDIVGGNFGFHYTVDQALPGILQHGLLSRWEEEKRGLRIRAHASRSLPNTIYFTTRINDLYFLSGEPSQSLDEILKGVVGIAIDRPVMPKEKRGHFGEEDVVGVERIRGLVIIDRGVEDKPTHEQADTYDKYKFYGYLSEDAIQARVDALRKICQEGGRDFPIYGVSGNLYWPQRKSWREIASTA